MIKFPEKLIIVGNGDFAGFVAYYVKHFFPEYTVAAYSADRAYIKEPRIDGIPVIALKDITGEGYPVDEYSFFCAIGYVQMNDVRREKFQYLKSLGYRSPNLIHPEAYIGPDVCMGEGNFIMERALISPMVTLGNSNTVWNLVVISHESKVGSFNHIACYCLGGRSIVGNNCFFGINSSVRGGQPIADYTYVGSNAYIGFPTEEGGVYLAPKAEQLKVRSSKDFLKIESALSQKASENFK